MYMTQAKRTQQGNLLGYFQLSGVLVLVNIVVEVVVVVDVAIMAV